MGSDKSELHIRRLKFNFPNPIPKYWNGGDLGRSYLFNAIAIIAPSFERLALYSVIAFKKEWQHWPQSSDIKAFIGQESAHGNAYEHYNQYFVQQGYQIQGIERMIQKTFLGIGACLPKKMHLSITLAGEHLAAIMADLVLKDSQWLAKAQVHCGAIWRWHAIEEIEHKAVVFDVYQALKGGYWGRLWGMVIATMAWGGFLTFNMGYMLKKDKGLLSFKAYRSLWSALLGKQGFFRALVKPYLAFFHPKFHPWQHNNRTLILHWRTFFKHCAFEDLPKYLQCPEPPYSG